MNTLRGLVSFALLACGLAAQSPILVSHGMGGQPADDMSWFPSVSDSGRYVLFSSFASNLVPGDTNGQSDVFLRDLVTDAIVRVSVGTDGTQATAECRGSDVSSNGRYVVFSTLATGLVPGGKPGLYVLDRQTGLLTEETLGFNGVGGGAGGEVGQIADDGSFVCFASGSNALVPGDTNNAADVFVRDRLSGVTERVSVSSTGVQGTGSSTLWPGFNVISEDGRYVVFDSQAPNLVPLPSPCTHWAYLRDRTTGQTSLLNITPLGQVGNGCSYAPMITEDGRYVAFTSTSTDLVPGDTFGSAPSVFLLDRLTGALTIEALATLGTQAPWGSGAQGLSSDGRFVAFQTQGQLVEQDDNLNGDAYLQDRLTKLTWLVSQKADGEQGTGQVTSIGISRDGRVVVFDDMGPMLPGSSAFGDVYAYDRFAAAPWQQLLGGVAGAQGIPVLAAEGTLLPQAKITFALANAAGIPTMLVVGLSTIDHPFKGGVLVPSPDAIVPLHGSGGLVKFPAIWPNGIPPGFDIFLQAWTPDAAAPFGLAASDTLHGTTP